MQRFVSFAQLVIHLCFASFAIYLLERISFDDLCLVK